MEKLLKKSKIPLTVVPISAASAPSEPAATIQMPFGEPTKHGWMILPDNNPFAFGPIYFAVLQRTSSIASHAANAEQSSDAESGDDEDDDDQAEDKESTDATK